MASLYKRANGRQIRVLRIVEGAVKNACDAHPGRSIDKRFARSVAKRAVGTLTAAWPDVLAVSLSPSETASSQVVKGSPSGSQLCKDRKRGALSAPRTVLPTLYRIHKKLGIMTGWARKADHDARAGALADALRVVGAEIKLLEGDE